MPCPLNEQELGAGPVVHHRTLAEDGGALHSTEKSCHSHMCMGKIDMSNFGSKKGEVPAALHVTKLKEIDSKSVFEKLLLLKHLQIRSSSGDIFKAPKIYHLFLEIQLFPYSDTHVLTLEMLTGQQLKTRTCSQWMSLTSRWR